MFLGPETNRNDPWGCFTEPHYPVVDHNLLVDLITSRPLVLKKIFRTGNSKNIIPEWQRDYDSFLLSLVSSFDLRNASLLSYPLKPAIFPFLLNKVTSSIIKVTWQPWYNMIIMIIFIITSEILTRSILKTGQHPCQVQLNLVCSDTQGLLVGLVQNKFGQPTGNVRRSSEVSVEYYG